MKKKIKKTSVRQVTNCRFQRTCIYRRNGGKALILGSVISRKQGINIKNLLSELGAHLLSTLWISQAGLDKELKIRVLTK
jgi:hypothetical protein